MEILCFSTLHPGAFLFPTVELSSLFSMASITDETILCAASSPGSTRPRQDPCQDATRDTQESINRNKTISYEHSFSPVPSAMLPVQSPLWFLEGCQHLRTHHSKTHTLRKSCLLCSRQMCSWVSMAAPWQTVKCTSKTVEFIRGVCSADFLLLCISIAESPTENVYSELHTVYIEALGVNCLQQGDSC